MLNFIDKFLDGITMYRLMLYYLITLFCTALGFSFFHIIPFSPISLILSFTVILVVCYISNKIFSYVLGVSTNTESFFITAFILSFIITPTTSSHGFVFLGWASLLAMSSKYILAVKKKHIFNPAAVAVFITLIALRESASWWIGTASMMPVIILGGLLIVRKIQRVSLVASFLIVALATSIIVNTGGVSIVDLIKRVLFDSSLFFLGFVMLTEPQTTPPTRIKQILYGVIVGLLFPPEIHIGKLYSTPEIALLIGNVFSYFVSPKERIILFLKEKIQVGAEIIDFAFPLKNRLDFVPGQYMEWTLKHKGVDSRGNRRFFTIASSPTEDILRLGVKFYEDGSSFKKAMQQMDDKSSIVGSQLSGNFNLPKDKNQKIVFIAGGIGITPYRSMLKYLLDLNEKRDIILFYSNKFAQEITYKNIFDSASEILGIKTVYTLTDTDNIPQDWMGRRGRIDGEMINSEAPDFKERLFYLSGPHVMVKGFEKVLKEMNVPSSQIKIDFFPGYA